MIELCIFYKQHEHRLIIRDVHTNEYQVVQHKVVVNMLMIYIVSQVVPDQAVLWLCKLRLFQHQTTATFDGPQKTVNLTKQLLVYDSYPFINICSDMFILSFTSGTHRSCQMGETDQLHKCILFLQSIKIKWQQSFYSNRFFIFIFCFYVRKLSQIENVCVTWPFPILKA